MSDYLCEELIVEIFTRLPVKSLLRFRSVSKSLRSCIGSPDFIRLHASRSQQQRLIFIHTPTFNNLEEYEDEDFCTLHAEDQLPLCPIRGYNGIPAIKFPRLNIVGSCNGILCQFDYRKSTVSLWNPSIMRQLILPDCARQFNDERDVGFGFDPITDDFKIVSIPLKGGTTQSSYVYTMKTRAWCPIASPMPLYSEVISEYCPCYINNGVLHWLVKDEELRCIMTLDLSTHVFGKIADV